MLRTVLAIVGVAAGLHAASVESRAAKIMIRAVDVEDVSPRDVFDFLREQSRLADPEGKGINMLFRFSPAGLKTFTQGTITLKMNHVPLSEIVRYVCIATGLLYSYDRYTLMVFDQAAPQSMETKVYHLKAGVLESRRTRDRPDELEGFGGGSSNRRD
jgi:hypothetical protein